MSNKIETLRALADEKNLFIIEALKRLEKRIERASSLLVKLLFNEFISSLDVVNGEIKSTDANLKKITSVEQVWEQFMQKQGFAVVDNIVRDLTQIMQLGSNYYTELIPRQVTSERVIKILNDKLGIAWAKDNDTWQLKKNGFVDALLNDRTIITDVRRIAYNNIISGTGPKNLKAAIDTHLIGTGEKKGAYHNYFSVFVFDTYSEVDRLNSLLHADRLKLKYFMYAGGVVADSREFCKERHGKVFTTDEAEEWRKLIGKYKIVASAKGKGLTKRVAIGPIVIDKTAYDPLTQLGGIRCRHSTDYITDDIAEYYLKKQKGN